MGENKMKNITITQFKTVDTLSNVGIIPAVAETLYRDLVNLRDRGFYCALLTYKLAKDGQWSVFLQNECVDDAALMSVATRFVKLVNGE